MRIVRIVNLFFALAVATMLTAAVARAGPSRLVLESDPSLFNGELFQLTFDTFDDFRNNNPSSFGPSQLGIERDFSVGGLAYDGRYRLILESDPSLSNGELYHVTFDTFDDFRNNNPSSFGPSQLGIERDFSVGGLAYDGQYRLILESDPSLLNGELFQLTFDTFDDFLNNDPSSFGPSQLGIERDFSVGGLAYDGQYRLILESDPSLSNGELFQLTFDTFDDFLNNDPSSFGPSQLGIERDFSVGGFAHEFDPVPGEDPSDVSEPSTLPLMGFALAIAGFITSRKRQLG